ncbi:LPS-assembly protein LptD [Desulforhopalus singaporensis]|uniref:LPS-assembly protein n=1 Tax=Desulforhopalus singaporensis TaxID=91360 RepID=A0A1H0NAY0_9BACT|nr:LPS assembly protein LptD [Desulforhopalus singaporensis]SDO89696.1 LPS-assembly protein [Desulforhopalus singaporensis]
MVTLSPGKNIRNCCLLFSALIFTSSTTAALADVVSTEEWNISADKVVRYESPNSIVATGNVVLEKKEKMSPAAPKDSQALTSWAELLEEDDVEQVQAAGEVERNAEPVFQTTVSIKADWIVYDVDLESIKAKGNVQIITDEDQLFANEGTLNLVSETGKFEDATILREKDSLHLEGEVIEKTGFDTYRIVDGWAITCKVEGDEPPPWSFSSARTDIRQGGYAVLKHAKFNIRNVPVLYTPYLILPVKGTRQTGFLFPEFSSSSEGGFAFDVPFFLNISDSADITFFPEVYLKRGVMPGMEFRYVSSPTDKGAFTLSYLDDDLSDPSETEYYENTGYTHDNSDRYWVRGKADYTFGDNWQTRLDLDIVSDQDYLKEFNSGTTGYKKTYERYLETFGRGFQNDTSVLRENSLKMLKNWRGISLQGELLAINDTYTTANESVTDDTDTPLFKLPSIDFSGTIPTNYAGISFNWDSEYVNYWREDGVGANRVDFAPSISAPLPLGPYLESRAEFKLRDTFYLVETYGDAEWEHDDTQNRFYPEFTADLATTLERDFFTSNAELATLRHQIRPFLAYGYIPDVDQDELPKLDSVDNIAERNAITYGLDNFFDKVASGSSGWDSLTEYATYKIQQSYDFSDDSDEPFSDIFSELRWKPIHRTYFEYKTYYDVYDSKFNSHTVEGNYTNTRGDQFGLEYSLKDSADIEQINAFVKAALVDRWLFKGEIQHSLSLQETIEAFGSLTYQALCWSVSLETRYTPEDTSYLVTFNLANIGLPLGIGL